ncbi:MAG: EamA family transporter [Nevskiaceae bacterium]|nr:MAG: EamA family transporter [Nevskiaceae bacterium]TAM22717.1 MAG: EamA family transporter [Nevskiaceae bacterium]
MILGFGEWCALACALCWAIAVILLKKSGESLSPFALNYIKNLLCLLALALTLLVTHGGRWPGMPGGQVALALFSGTLGIALADTLYFRALNSIGAARMGVAGTAFSPLVILLAAIFLGERLSPLQIAGVAITLSGIALVTYVKTVGKLDAQTLRRGVLLGVTSVAVMAAGVVIAKPILESQDFLWVVFLRLLGGVAVMTLLLSVRRQWSALAQAYRGVRHWPQVIAGSLMGTYVSNLFWLAGYKYADASIAAVLNELSAIFIVLLAALVLKEKLQARQMVGCGLAVLGVIVVVVAA